MWLSRKSRSLRSLISALSSRALDNLFPYRVVAREQAAVHARCSELERRFSEERSAMSWHILNMREQTVKLFERRTVLEKRLPRRASPYNIDEFLGKLALMFPSAFPIWKQAFDTGAREYDARQPSSLSIEGNVGAEAFRKFLALYAHGHVLDIGCGPQELPSYFVGFDIERLAGIDPLPREESRFEFVQGFAENLPWPSEEFDTVTIATSLDHVLSLDMALSEVKRVLKPGGALVIWVGFVPGAAPYDPMDPELKAIDAFHLFHFDREWFVGLVRKYFTMSEELDLDGQSHFYTFLKI